MVYYRHFSFGSPVGVGVWPKQYYYTANGSLYSSARQWLWECR